MLKKASPPFIAFLQVTGVVIYILILTASVNYASENFNNDSFFGNQVVGMTFFLLTFVTSAFICGSLVLGYPLYLFLGGEKRKAITIALWSAFWFVAALLFIIVASLLLQDDVRYVLLGA